MTQRVERPVIPYREAGRSVVTWVAADRGFIPPAAPVPATVSGDARTLRRQRQEARG